MAFYTAIVLGVLLTLVLCCVPAEAEAGVATADVATTTTSKVSTPQQQSYFMALRDLSHFSSTVGEKPGTTILTSPEMETPLAWDQLIVSWNATLPPEGFLQIEARAISADRTTKYYKLGLWSEDPAKHPRESVKNQADGDGNVQTDTLVLKRPVTKVQLRITIGQSQPSQVAVQQETVQDAKPPALNGVDKQAQQLIKLIGLNFFNSKVKLKPLEPNRAAWDKVIEVPERSQVSYQGGLGWCSPTCVSMNLWHWSRVLNRPELNKDVPEVARGVFDKAWGGTGNWPFNTAFAGSFPGLRAYISRFSDVSELEDWIVAGIPVILSVSYDLLKGKTQSKDAGHLIMCVGFTEQGDIIVNDPWARLENGEKVRKTFPRQNLIKAWNNSRNTVYLIYPETALLPKDRFGHWEAGPQYPQ